MASSTDRVADDAVTRLVGELVVSAHRLTRLAAQAVHDPQNPAVWRTLSALRHLGPVRLGELARQSRVSQPTMTKIVQNLEDAGWTRRIADVNDGRASLIEGTDAGFEALDAWREALAGALAPYFSDLSDVDRAALARTLEVIDERIAVDAERR